MCGDDTAERLKTKRVAGNATESSRGSHLENIVPSILIIASSLVWTWAMIRCMRSKPIIPAAGTPESVPIVALALGGLWVVISVTSQVSAMVGDRMKTQAATEAKDAAAKQPKSTGPAKQPKRSKVGTTERKTNRTKPSGLELEGIKKNVYITGGIALFLAVIYSLGNQTKQENELPVLRAISLGFLAFLASMMPVLMALWVIEKTGAGQTSHSLLTFMQAHRKPTDMMWVAASAVVVAPLLEELVYRVILQRAISERFGSKVAIVVVAIVFSFVHGWPNMVGLLPLAVVLGYVFEQTNNYLAVVATHAWFNMCMLLLTVLSMNS